MGVLCSTRYRPRLSLSLLSLVQMNSIINQPQNDEDIGVSCCCCWLVCLVKYRFRCVSMLLFDGFEAYGKRTSKFGKIGKNRLTICNQSRYERVAGLPSRTLTSTNDVINGLIYFIPVFRFSGSLGRRKRLRYHYFPPENEKLRNMEIYPSTRRRFSVALTTELELP